MKRTVYIKCIAWSCRWDVFNEISLIALNNTSPIVLFTFLQSRIVIESCTINSTGRIRLLCLLSSSHLVNYWSILFSQSYDKDVKQSQTTALCLWDRVASSFSAWHKLCICTMTAANHTFLTPSSCCLSTGSSESLPCRFVRLSFRWGENKVCCIPNEIRCHSWPFSVPSSTTISGKFPAFVFPLYIFHRVIYSSEAG